MENEHFVLYTSDKSRMSFWWWTPGGYVPIKEDAEDVSPHEGRPVWVGNSDAGYVK